VWGGLRGPGGHRARHPAVLDAAREVLWSAVAAEMLALDPATGTTARKTPDQERKTKETGA
jgi:hypothetical protein